MLSLMNRAVGRVVAWGDGGDPMPKVHATAGYGIGAALQITSLVWLPGSHPSCQPSAEPKFSFAVRAALASRGSFRRVAPARARFALTPERVRSAVTWSARAAAARGAGRTGHLGAAGRPGAECDAQVSDQICLRNEVGHFSGRRNGATA